MFFGRAGDEGALLVLTGDNPHLILPVQANALGELRRNGRLEFESRWAAGSKACHCWWLPCSSRTDSWSLRLN